MIQRIRQQTTEYSRDKASNSEKRQALLELMPPIEHRHETDTIGHEANLSHTPPQNKRQVISPGVFLTNP